jgi:hypothetical protein
MAGPDIGWCHLAHQREIAEQLFALIVERATDHLRQFAGREFCDRVVLSVAHWDVGKAIQRYCPRTTPAADMVQDKAACSQLQVVQHRR